MSKIITLSALIGLVAIVAIAAAEEQCDDCMKQAAAIKPDLTRGDIEIWITNITNYCDTLQDAESQDKCLNMVNSTQYQLNQLLGHSEREFCQWLGQCHTSSLSLSQLARPVHQIMYPKLNDDELQCQECRKAADELKYFLKPANRFTKVVELKTNECYQKQNATELDQCLALVGKLYYGLSYLINHESEDYCSWANSCKNRHAKHDIKQAWQEIQTESSIRSCEKCLARALKLRNSLTGQSLDVIFQRGKDECDKVADETMRKRCLIRLSEHQKELKYLLYHIPMEFCQWKNACPTGGVSLAKIINLL